MGFSMPVPVISLIVERLVAKCLFDEGEGGMGFSMPVPVIPCLMRERGEWDLACLSR